ncbi:MAG TPA: hypothetical protein VFQ16_09865 [Burkholderiaceae bacterium]|nr:hypothetical protein [Burkholderiaceae bacterium]
MSGSSSSNPDAAAAAEPVHLTVHPVAPLELSSTDAARRTARGRWKLLLVLAICAAPVIASYFTFYVLRPQGRSNYATLVDPPRAIPEGLALTDLDGRGVAAQALRGQWLLVSVGGGQCDAACEQRLYAQRQLHAMLGRERDRIDKVWFVVDDAPLRPALREALSAAPATQVLRVPPTALTAWLQPAAGEPLEAHLYLVDPRGQWMMRAPSRLEPSRFKRDLERLLRASSSWDTPGR